MKLIAEHFDGFTEHVLSWILEADGGSAIVEASWRMNGRRINKLFEMDFDETRIQQCAAALAGLKPEYNGQVDDFPIFRLSVTLEDRKLTTRVRAGIHWPEEDQAAMDTLMKVWRPICSDIEKLLAIPGRSKKRK